MAGYSGRIGIGAFTVNLEHRITAINYCAQALIGLRRKEVLQCDCREIFTGVPCLVSCKISNDSPNMKDDSDIEITDESNIKHLITRMATPIVDYNRKVVGCFTILQDHSPIIRISSTASVTKNKALKTPWTASTSVYLQ